MAENTKPIKMPHNVIMEDRKNLTVSGVDDVDSFDEENIVAYTDMGEMTIRGSDLHISKLSTESGDLQVTGNIRAIVYSDNDNTASKGNFFSKIFK